MASAALPLPASRPRWLDALAATAALAAALLVPAILNRFPLIFPDSGTYLGIAFGSEYAIDRSSVYGLLLKPLVALAPGAGGLWLAIGAQALLVAVILLAAARALRPRASWGRITVELLPIVALTALPWHAGQFMPDALTGPLVLTTWLLASRPVRADGNAALWALAALLATTHYTHPFVAIATASAALAGRALAGDKLSAVAKASIASLTAAVAAILALVAMNGVAVGRWTLSPVGSAFLFARLNEDGLIRPWLDATCRGAARSPICGERNRLPADSQKMLWGDGSSVVERHIWGANSDAERWAWADAFSQANRGSILASPLRFAGNSARAGWNQFTTFRAVDDECPVGCGDPVAGIGSALSVYRPDTYPLLQASAQRRGTTPKLLVRAITTPIATLSLLLLPIAGLLAWRRGDRIATALVAGIAGALVANAAMAGALSDVHDRYQSRIVWLAPFALLLIALRWRSADGLEQPLE